MQLNDNTMNVLKNFATINPNIVVNAGHTVKTITEAKNVLATAKLDQDFPETFGIYDLNEFLTACSLVDNPTLDFESDYCVIRDSSGRSKVKYYFSEIDILTTPAKDITMPGSDVSFKLDNSTLNRLRKASSAFGHTELSISGTENGVLSLSILDSKNSTSNAFSIDVNGEYHNSDFNYIINISNLKMIPGDYDVSISSKLISHFKNSDSNIEYWIALEKSSTTGV
jgi:hypothetical protein